MQRILTAKEAAALLKINVFTLYKFSRERVIPSIRYGRRLVRFDEGKLLEWLKDNSVERRQNGEKNRI